MDVHSKALIDGRPLIDGRHLHVLMIEESHDKVSVPLKSLRAAGYVVDFRLVPTLADLRAALGWGGWDAIICAESVPHFSVQAAAAMAREMRPEVPFIVISQHAH
jgi:DNA-binding NtrC family response regulator